MVWGSLARLTEVQLPIGIEVVKRLTKLSVILLLENVSFIQFLSDIFHVKSE